MIQGFFAAAWYSWYRTFFPGFNPPFHRTHMIVTYYPLTNVYTHIR